MVTAQKNKACAHSSIRSNSKCQTSGRMPPSVCTEGKQGEKGEQAGRRQRRRGSSCWSTCSTSTSNAYPAAGGSRGRHGREQNLHKQWQLKRFSVCESEDHSVRRLTNPRPFPHPYSRFSLALHVCSAPLPFPRPSTPSSPSPYHPYTPLNTPKPSKPPCPPPALNHRLSLSLTSATDPTTSAVPFLA